MQTSSFYSFSVRDKWFQIKTWTYKLKPREIQISWILMNSLIDVLLLLITIWEEVLLMKHGGCTDSQRDSDILYWRRRRQVSNQRFSIVRWIL